ncbi:AAA family ATPase [Xanthobacter autotrophicus]|uniref:AAA family ATPase n=1 Tax=Xanthobacter autotrophicus TaxID=280 RepID=UPI0037290B6A
MSDDAWTSIAEHDGLGDGGARTRPQAARRRKPNGELHQPDADHGHADNSGDLTADDIARLAPMLDASAFDGVEVPEREWHVEHYVPKHTVTILSGDGAVGKSTIAVQLLASTVFGRDWLGLPVAAGPVIYVAAEDSLDELHRRFATIMDDMETSFAQLAGRGLHLIPLADCEDALLAIPDRSGNLRPTPRYCALEKRIEQVRPVLVVFDTRADLFGGDEIKRAHARQFIGLLRALAIRHRCTNVLLDHPSQSGMSAGTGTSGSTAWNNSVRSRLYFERVKGEDGADTDPDLRRLTVMKANYAQSGLELRVRWERGVFVPVPTQGTAAYGAQAAADYAEEVFLRMLRTYIAEKRDVSHNPSRTFAPAIFAKDHRAEGLKNATLKQAMDRLFEKKKIAVHIGGSPSRPRHPIILAKADA